MKIVLVLVSAIAVVALAPTPARGEPGAADALFKAGKDLMAEGKVPEACAKYEASYREEAALGALMNLADCREQEGLIAASWARWGEAVEKAKKLGDNRVSYCQDRRNKLGPRLPYLTVRVTHPVQGLTLYRGSHVLDPGAYGTPLPIEPGETTLQVTKGDDVFWQKTIKVAEGEQASVDVDLQRIYDSAPADKKKRSQGSVKGGGNQVTPQLPFWSSQRISGLVIGSVGLIGVGAGFGVGGVALGKKSAIDEGCSPLLQGKHYCTQKALDAQDSARTLANVSQWTLIASAVVTSVGITVFATAPSTTPTRALDKRADLAPALRFVAPVPLDRGGGVVAGGSF